MGPISPAPREADLIGTRGIRRRLERVEAGRQTGEPDRIFSARPLEDGEAEFILANWREWVADGRASRSGNLLLVMDPPMTVAEWVERFAAPNRRLN